MRKITTILCSLAFMISGIMMAMTVSNSSATDTGYKSMSAATPMSIMDTPILPSIINDTGTLDIPEDLLRDLAKRKGVLDTVYVTKTDTNKEQVTKVKRRKVTAPKPVMEINVTASSRTDTILVPVYYLATQVGNKEGPTGQKISLYEVHKIDEVDLKTNSSVELVNEQDVDVGE